MEGSAVAKRAYEMDGKIVLRSKCMLTCAIAPTRAENAIKGDLYAMHEHELTPIPDNLVLPQPSES